MRSIALFLAPCLFAAPFAQASTCNPTYLPGDLINPARIVQVLPNSAPNVSLTLLGNIVITGGCQFTFSNATYFYAAANSYWAGSNSTDSSASVWKICDTTVQQLVGGQSASFTLNSNPPASFFDFYVIKLFDQGTNSILGYAQIRNIPATSTVVVAPTPTPTATRSSSSASGTAARVSFAGLMAVVAGGMVLVAML